MRFLIGAFSLYIIFLLVMNAVRKMKESEAKEKRRNEEEKSKTYKEVCKGFEEWVARGKADKQ